MFRILTFLLCLSTFSFISYAAENTVTAGTTLKVRMAEPIDSKTRKAGYRFKVNIETMLKQGNRTIIKSGTQGTGLINHIRKSAKREASPEIILTLTNIQINNRQVQIDTFPLAGKGTTTIRKKIGEVDKHENTVTNKQGEKITATIPLQTKGHDITLTEGTILYFILKTPIIF